MQEHLTIPTSEKNPAYLAIPSLTVASDYGAEATPFSSSTVSEPITTSPYTPPDLPASTDLPLTFSQSTLLSDQSAPTSLPFTLSEQAMLEEFADTQEETELADTEEHLPDPFLGVTHLPASAITVGKAIGHGAFGQVYQGQWGERPVALKMIDLAQAKKNLPDLSEAGILESLQWEISRLSTVSHPQLVSFYGIYEVDNIIYLAMEFCLGGDLQKRLAKGNVSWSKRWQWALEITQGLAYLHEQGVLHRDLKAENVLLDANDRAKLADLGVAQVDALLQDKEAQVVAEGLQDKKFIAPENIKNPTLSSKETDVYALGLVFWQLTTGQVPRRLNTLSLAEYQGWQTGKGLREPIPSDCPEPFRQLILACWAHEPADRIKLDILCEQLRRLALEFHPYPQETVLLESLDSLLHSKRSAGLVYVPSMVTQYPVNEPLDNYWQRWESSTLSEEEAKFHNPPLKLADMLESFLQQPGSGTLLLLGESGLGKTLSVYQWADRLLKQGWERLNEKSKHSQYLPLLVRPALVQWTQADLKDGLAKTLAFYGLPTDFAQPLVLIIDGYDECIGESVPVNLAQQLGLPAHSTIKLVITCRPEIVPANELNHRFANAGQLQTYYFLPFSMDQLFHYMTHQLLWSKEMHQTYQMELAKNTALRAVLRNPFVLSLCVESWSIISKKDVNRLDRWQIYASFVEHILATQGNLLSTTVKKRLCGKETNLLASLNRITAEVAFKAFQSRGLILNEKTAQKSIASDWLALEQAVATDSRHQFKLRQKALAAKKVQGQGVRRTLLSEADYVAIQVWRSQQFQQYLPLKHKAFGYEFSHKSFFEYFIAKRLTLIRESNDPAAEGLALLNARSLQEEPEILRFWTEGWQELETCVLTEPLFEIIQFSRENKTHIQAASNAATLLAMARAPFSGRDLSKVCIPGADLSGAIFDHTSFKAADLKQVKLKGCYLGSTDFTDANMEGIYFGEYPALTFNGKVSCIAYSSDGRHLAIGEAKTIKLFQVKDGTGWFEEIGKLKGHTKVIGADTLFLESSKKSALPLYVFLKGSIVLQKAKDRITAYWSESSEIKADNLLLKSAEKNSPPSALDIPENTVLLQKVGYEITAYWSEDSQVKHKKNIEYDIDRRLVRSLYFPRVGQYRYVLMLSGNLPRFTEAHVLYLLKNSDDTIIPYSPTENLKKLSAERYGELKCISNLPKFPEDGEEPIKISQDHDQELFNEITSICGGYSRAGEAENIIKLEDNYLLVKWVVSICGDVKIKRIQLDIENAELEASLNFPNIGEQPVIIEDERLIKQITSMYGYTYGASYKNIAFSADGKFLVSGSKDMAVRLWDTASQKPLLVVQGENESKSKCNNCVVFSPERKILAFVATSRKTVLWDTVSQKPLAELEEHSNLAFSPDGKILASTKGDLIYLWDTTNANLLSELKKGGNNNSLNSITFSPDGKILASGRMDSGNSDGGIIDLWDITNGSLLAELKGHHLSVLSVAFRSDGKILASGGDDGTIWLWDVENRKSLSALYGHTKSVLSIAFSPNGKTLISGSKDKTVRVWEAENQNSLTVSQGHTAPILTIAFSPDGKTIASGSEDKTLRLWNAANGNPVAELKKHAGIILSVVYRRDGQQLASAESHSQSIDGNVVRIWDTKNWNLLAELKGHTGNVTSLAFSPDGKMLASGSSDKTVWLWDTINGNFLAELKKEDTSSSLTWVESVAFSPDGKTLASGRDAVYLWDPEKGNLLGELKGHTSSVYSLAFSPDGKMLASGSSDKTVRLWDMASRRSLAELKGHTGFVRSVAFSTDGKMLASGSWDRTIRLWDAVGGNLLTTLKGHMGSVHSIAFSPDGQNLASADSCAAIFIWSKTITEQTNAVWILFYRFATAVSLCSQDMYFKGANLSRANVKLLQQGGANDHQAAFVYFLSRSSKISIKLFSQFFSVVNGIRHELGRYISQYLGTREKQSMACINYGCYKFFAFLDHLSTENEAVINTQLNTADVRSLSVCSSLFSVPGEMAYQDGAKCFQQAYYQKALACFKEAADESYPAAYLYLGRLYQYDGLIGAKNLKESEKWYEKVKTCIEWFKVQARTGQADAQYNLGRCYDFGIGVNKDAKKAVQYYRLAADKGLADAQYNLGFCYDAGRGVEQDYKEAVRYYCLAAEQGHANARNTLGYLYYNGQGVPQDFTQAVHYYHLAADQGSSYAQFNLGDCYRRGNGAVQDINEARRYFQLSAAQNHPPAQYILAADQGDAEAQFKLALCYENGDQVSTDTEEALHYYRLAAAQGHSEAPKHVDQLLAKHPELSSLPVHSSTLLTPPLSRETSSEKIILPAFSLIEAVPESIESTINMPTPEKHPSASKLFFSPSLPYPGDKKILVSSTSDEKKSQISVGKPEKHISSPPKPLSPFMLGKIGFFSKQEESEQSAKPTQTQQPVFTASKQQNAAKQFWKNKEEESKQEEVRQNPKQDENKKILYPDNDSKKNKLSLT